MEKKNKNLTIPNALSVLRILLIPVFVYFYAAADSETHIYYLYAVLALAISGLTDLFDGYIARRLDQVTNLGKILDPLADKLTQLTVVISVAIKLRSMPLAAALMIFVVKELLMLLGGLFLLRRHITIQGSKWYGKVATAVFYVVMAAVALFDGMSGRTALLLIGVAAVFMLFAFSQYLLEFFRILREDKINQPQHIIEK